MRTSLYCNLFQNCNPLNLLLKARSINMGNFYWKKWYFIEVQEWLKLDRSQPLFYFVFQEILTVKLAGQDNNMSLFLPQSGEMPSAKLFSFPQSLWINKWSIWQHGLPFRKKRKYVEVSKPLSVYRCCALPALLSTGYLPQNGLDSRVYKRKFCVSVCLSVRHHSFLLQISSSLSFSVAALH